MSDPLKAFAAEPYAYADARVVADQLGLSEPVAVTLVRRGYRTPEQARAFLAADESHPPLAFAGMGSVVERLQAAIAAKRRITVHGDFDVDGVCATTIMVSTLRELGADCDWLIPDRLSDGYGLSAANVKRLTSRGTSLLLTVDCGITAVDEVRLAQELGLEVIVTDHHQPGPELPDCLILHPSLSSYPFEHLCGTAVAWKLATALREGSEGGSPDAHSRRVSGDPPSDPSPATAPSSQVDVSPGTEEGFRGDADLDLVALATVADLVPLTGENRSLVKKGLAEMRRARRPGLRALMAASKCDPDRLDESDLGFRLAPRINAAGRLYRADAGVELMLTGDESRAEEIAVELSRANAERRATEREVDAAAEAARRELPERLRDDAPALVLAGEDWHPGVIGIVASRLVERHHRPAIVISLDGDGEGRGSGRSIPGFDLHAALEACAEHLVSFGGHRAAAGLTLRAEDLDAFREAFVAYAVSVLEPEHLRRTERIDAVVGGAGLGLDLAEELGRLAPFGIGNPGVRLMVPAARVSDVRTMGEGKHARFSLHSGNHRALGVAFGRSSLGVEDDEAVDAAVRLEVNHWNGAVEPRLVLRELYPVAEPDEEPAVSLHRCECRTNEWWERFGAEHTRDLAEGVTTLGRIAGKNRHTQVGGGPGEPQREVVRGGGSAVARIAELVSSGAGVLAVCADASRRAALATGAGGLARFNGGAGRVACARCGAAALDEVVAKSSGGLALVDYATLASPAAARVAEAFEHIVLVDPPPSPLSHAAVSAPRAVAAGAPAPEVEEPAGDSSPPASPGYVYPVWTAAEREFSLAVLDEQFASRETVARVFRALRDAGEASGEELRQALGGSGAHPLGPEAAARCFRVLAELDLVAGEPNGGGGTVGVVSSEGTDLRRSAAFRAYRADHSEAQQYLARLGQQ